MKRNLLALIICFFTLTSSATTTDTLTNAQIYNFNVGDTFQYRYTAEDIDMGMPFHTWYSRIVLKQKTVSANTLDLGYGLPGDSVITQGETITDLDSFPILQIQNMDTTSCSMNYSFDTTVYAGYASNGLNINCFESGVSYRYTKGLGRTLYGSSHVGNIGYGTVGSSEQLIYYSNGVTHVGTPYIPPTPFPVHYIPLPETCAVWTRTIHGSYSGYAPFGTITEQIHTGNQIHKGGKTYVELICRIQNDISNRFTPDSLIGYFYNDSANLSAHFVTDTNGTAYYLCSFTGVAGQQCSYNGYYSLDSVLIGGVYRTYWGCSGSSDCNDAKIAGIGRLSGLIPINHLYNSPGHITCGYLSGFCVCGQKLYPNDTIHVCDLLSGISDFGLRTSDFGLYPNPASNNVTITIDETLLNSTLTVYDITGKKMTAVQLRSSVFGLPTTDFASGIYFVTLENEKGRTTKKLIIQK